MTQPPVTQPLEAVVRESSFWHRRNFPDATLADQGLVLAEEVGEVCRAIVKDGQAIRGTHLQWMAELRKELGDVAIATMVVSHVAGFDFPQLVADRWEEIRQRDWSHNRAGHGMPGADAGESR